jgi:hypothetical protein
MVGSSVAALAVFPLVTVFTLWPLRLAFLVSRPTLETLANQIAAGKSMTYPQRGGLFRFETSSINSSTGNIGLLIEPNPAHPTGLVRKSPRGDRSGPISSSGLGVDLGWGWEYRQED